MITTNVIQRVFRILHNGNTASSYTIEKGANQYLVSAAHVFEGSEDVTHLNIYQEGQWKILKVQTVFNSLDVGDTIVFKLPYDISQRHEVSLGPDKIALASWAYFLGFPFGMSTPSGKINNDFPIPFIKAALISSLNSEREGLTTIYLDGHNNRGFSGGPAVWVNPLDPIKMRIMGTVSKYFTESPINTETMDEVDIYGTNAGIIEVYWIRDILNII